MLGLNNSGFKTPIRYLNQSALILFLVLLGAFTSASEEEIAHWRSVEINFGALGNAKTVQLAARANDSEVTSLKISAFSKTYDLTTESLKKIRGFSLEGIRVTHEAGFERIGGYTVYFKLAKNSYTTKINKAEIAIISIQKIGEPKVEISVADKM